MTMRGRIIALRFVSVTGWISVGQAIAEGSLVAWLLAFVVAAIANIALEISIEERAHAGTDP